MFILTNLDRIQYGLPPLTGLVAALDQNALRDRNQARVRSGAVDASGELAEYTSNWAGVR